MSDFGAKADIGRQIATIIGDAGRKRIKPTLLPAPPGRSRVAPFPPQLGQRVPARSLSL